MVGKSGAFVLSVPADPDSTQYHPLFYRADACGGKVCNVLLPFAFYYLLMTLSRNCGKMFWILFLFIFFGAFQIVLLYLFGQSIIAVDMFLNLVTTNSSEAMELLDKSCSGISECDYPLYTGIDSGCNLHYKEAEIIFGIYPSGTEKGMDCLAHRFYFTGRRLWTE